MFHCLYNKYDLWYFGKKASTGLIGYVEVFFTRGEKNEDGVKLTFGLKWSKCYIKQMVYGF